MSEYIEPDVTSLDSSEVPAPEVPGPFVDPVDSEVPETPEYIEPFVMDDASSEEAPPPPEEPEQS